MDFVRGEILCHPCYVYPDGGEPCDKLLLVVNKHHCSPEDVVIIPCKSKTPQDPHYAAWCDTSLKVFFFSEKIGYYNAGTVLQLLHISTIPCHDLEEKILKYQITRQGKRTTEQEFGRIINCLKRMKYDISECIQDMIF